MSPVPYLDLKAQYRGLQPDIDAAVRRVFESSEFVLGGEVERFEQEFADYCGVRHAIGVNSGTSALHLALLAAGVGPGDEVITVPFTFVATTAAIRYAGARPVFVDVEPATYGIDSTQIEARITSRTKAILPVHLYGHACDMDAVLEIARRRSLAVIEDAAQAHGALYKGRRAGSMGDLSAFSFYPTKNLGGCGEGGLVATNDEARARQVRMLRNWGAERRYQHVLKGFNYRMEAIQGAVLRVKLKRLEEWTEARRAHAAAYNQLLGSSGLTLPRELPGARHVYHCYTIVAPDRAALEQRLRAAGIGYAVHYPQPIHLMEAHADLGYRRGDFPVAESLAERVLSLPMFPELTPAQIEQVAQAVGS